MHIVRLEGANESDLNMAIPLFSCHMYLDLLSSYWNPLKGKEETRLNNTSLSHRTDKVPFLIVAELELKST
jgi:hypothetical protein